MRLMNAWRGNSAAPAAPETHAPANGTRPSAEVAPVRGRKAPQIYFPSLDALRFIAFFLVFLRHGFGEALRGFDFGPYPVNTFVQACVLGAGDIGVEFFFVLSGFLITYLILTEINSTEHLNVPAFYLRRCLRIWPLYYSVLAIGLVVSYVQGPMPSPGGVGCYLCYLSNFNSIGWLQEPMHLGVTWSVAIEEQFYLAWPLLFAVVPRRRQLFLFAGIILASVAFRAVNRNDSRVLALHSLAVISDMAIGGLAAYLVLNRPSFKGWLAGLRRRWIVVIYLAGIAVVMHRNYVYDVPTESVALLRLCSALVVLRRVILGTFFVFVILEQIYCQRAVWRLSQMPLLSVLGRYTYGLYLLHPLALLAAAWCLGAAPDTESTLGLALAVGGLGFVFSMVFSVASYHLYEKRFLLLKKRFAVVQSGAL